MKASLVIVTTAIACAGVSAAGLAFWATPQLPDRMAPDPIVLGTIPSAAPLPPMLSAAMDAGTVSPPAVFSVSNFKRKTVCLVERGAALTSRSRDFFAPPDCALVWPGLTEATTWTQNEDGSVTISDSSGTTLLMLTRGRHFSYEVTDMPDADLALLMLP
jgi:hypothetical protein